MAAATRQRGKIRRFRTIQRVGSPAGRRRLYRLKSAGCCPSGLRRPEVLRGHWSETLRGPFSRKVSRPRCLRAGGQVMASVDYVRFVCDSPRPGGSRPRSSWRGGSGAESGKYGGEASALRAPTGVLRRRVLRPRGANDFGSPGATVSSSLGAGKSSRRTPRLQRFRVRVHLFSAPGSVIGIRRPPSPPKSETSGSIS